MMNSEKMLTTRQKQILEYIRDCVHKYGYPPSVQGNLPVRRAQFHLNGARLSAPAGRTGIHTPRPGEESYHRTSGRRILAVQKDRSPAAHRTVRAGQPVFAEECIEDVYPFSADFIGNDDCFMLTVRGDSMIQAGIFDGDYLIVRRQDTAENGDIVVALIDDEATVKRYFLEKDRVRLQPENPDYEPIYTRNCKILGKVTNLFRRY